MIAGEAKGRRLTSVPGDRVRPMTDQIREALFSSLGPQVRGARFLDLYAGSGAVGIEALSRGATHVTFVEQESEAVGTIRSNLAATGFERNAEIVPTAVEEYLAREVSFPYDLVMIDPPFRVGLPVEVLQSLVRSGMIVDGVTVILRVASRLALEELPAPFALKTRRRYGDSILLYMSVEGGLK